MNDAWRKREVWIFLVLMVIANSLFMTGLSSGLLPLRLYNMGRFLLLAGCLGAVVFAIRRFEGLFALVRSLSVWRVNPLWYLLALVWAPSMSILFLAGKSLLTGVNAFDDLTWGLVRQPSMWKMVFIASLVGEIVWVAYSIETVSKRAGMLGGSLIVGGFWSLWWLPMAIFGKGVIPEVPIGPLFVAMTGIATMAGFIYLSSRSGVVVFLLQVMVNASFLVFPVVPTHGGPMTYLAYSATYLAAGLMLWIFFGPRPLFRRPGDPPLPDAAGAALAA